MRNKITLAIAAVGMMYVTSAFADTPTVDHKVGPFGKGTVTFTGSVTNSPCSVDSKDTNLTVDFGQVSYRELKGAGATQKSAQSFVIHLKDCEFDKNNPDVPGSAGQMSKVQVSFTGTSTGDKAYDNTPGSGRATGVGVQLLDSKMTPLVPSEVAMPNNKTEQQLHAGDNQLEFFARLMNQGTVDSVTPGDINIPLNYTLTYL
ncbi:fimbrial protein [Salmonella enterica]|nr:fimbrial protein StdA [Salmonella enterica subsp. enterica serovar Oranienburg]EEH5174554.1 fimbrial protein [Salmonella enterica]EFQ5900688.1 fimbrial protein [Salmonella enterica]EHE6023657.1 fimbrial protein [Salmonella enterica]EHP2853030.1 fimbrial protein [Salmonella enterica]